MYFVTILVKVFGRGTFGGGGFNTGAGLEQIQLNGTSAALFAPGWTFENMGPNRRAFDLVEDKFWIGRNFVELLKNGDGKEGFMHWAICESWALDDDGYNSMLLLFYIKY